MPSRQADLFREFPDADADWTEDQWKALLSALVAQGLLNWQEVTSLTLGHLNPSQVGTSIASKKAFQRHFPKRKCWAAVREWHFDLSGQCLDCGTRLELQADHAIPKELAGDVAEQVRLAHQPISSADPLVVKRDLTTGLEEALRASSALDETTAELRAAIVDELTSLLRAGAEGRGELCVAADRLDNMVLRCRRCNVVRRPSHARGGQTFLTAESALMWILLVKRPATYEGFHDLCRAYGLSMANIRFEEAWAMARWLHRHGLYDIRPSSKYPPTAE